MSKWHPALKLRGLKTYPIEVPMTYALGTSATTVRKAPLLLVDLETSEGVTGRTYLFCYTLSGARAIDAVLREAVESVEGEFVAPVDIAVRLGRRYALLGVTGVARMALSALDAACWDALAIAAAVPLATLLGARPTAIRAYNSNGLGLSTPEAAADEAQRLLAGGFRAIKLRLGYATLEKDLAVTRAVRKRLPDKIELFVDYNQALTVAEAIRRGRALEAEGVSWIEEPTRHDDLRGNAQIARELSLPLQLGENFNGPEAMAQALEADACDYVMPDAGRIGGVTGWLNAAGIAAAHGIEMSSHLLPELSAHLLAATPTRHWLEYVDWADKILEEPLQVRDGCAIIPERPGSGMTWDMAAVKSFRCE